VVEIGDASIKDVAFRVVQSPLLYWACPIAGVSRRKVVKFSPKDKNK